MHTPIKSIAGLALAIFVIGCGSSSPTAPDNQPAGGTTATISGSVRAGSPLLSAGTGSNVEALVVSVVGTNLRSGLDAAGRFSLAGVPSGDVQLNFSGAGVDSTVTLAQVQPSQSVSLGLNVTGSTIVVESEARMTSTEQELEGRVESLPPTMDPGFVKVAGRTVKTDTNTRYEQGGTSKSFDDLKIGMRVHVKGTPSGSDLLASVIRIQNTNTWIPVNVSGTIDSVSGTGTLFQFKIGSRWIKGDALTEFFGRGGSFAELKDGVRVEVKGQQRDGYIYAERIHINGDDDNDDDDEDQDQSASIHGELKAMTGGKPMLTLTVGTTTVRTNGATVVQRRGDVQTLDQLKIGQQLHVIGTRQADGSLEARRIQINDDATGAEFEIEGSLGGLKGSCPAVSFGVNGFDIKTSGSTVFEGGACSSLKSGDAVLVKGIKQADGSVLATRVKR